MPTTATEEGIVTREYPVGRITMTEGWVTSEASQNYEGDPHPQMSTTTINRAELQNITFTLFTTIHSKCKGVPYP